MFTLNKRFAVRTLSVITLIALLVVVAFAVSTPQTASASSYPNLKFPWDKGYYKIWTTGLHGPYGPSYYWSVQPLSKLYAVDFGGYFTVLAAGSGTVEDASGVPGCGRYGIRIRHNSTWTTEYCHLSKRYVKIGQWVPQGKPIGYTGTLGCGSCGAHLHFALRKNGHYETWDDKVVDGWRFHAVHYLSGGLIYGQGTATREGSYWALSRGKLADWYKPYGAWVKTWIGFKGYTKISSATLVATDPPFMGLQYGSSSSNDPDFRFYSTNQRR